MSITDQSSTLLGELTFTLEPVFFSCMINAYFHDLAKTKRNAKYIRIYLSMVNVPYRIYTKYTNARLR